MNRFNAPELKPAAVNSQTNSFDAVTSSGEITYLFNTVGFPKQYYRIYFKGNDKPLYYSKIIKEGYTLEDIKNQLVVEYLQLRQKYNVNTSLGLVRSRLVVWMRDIITHQTGVSDELWHTAKVGSRKINKKRESNIKQINYISDEIRNAVEIESETACISLVDKVELLEKQNITMKHKSLRTKINACRTLNLSRIPQLNLNDIEETYYKLDYKDIITKLMLINQELVNQSLDIIELSNSEKLTKKLKIKLASNLDLMASLAFTVLPIASYYLNDLRENLLVYLYRLSLDNTYHVPLVKVAKKIKKVTKYKKLPFKAGEPSKTYVDTNNGHRIDSIPIQIANLRSSDVHTPCS